MSIAVGRRINQDDPSLEGYEKILCLTKSSPYGECSPYVLKHETLLSNGKTVMSNLENIWQFSKIYEKIEYSRQIKSRFQPDVIWEHPPENHIINGIIQKEYWLWRDKGLLTEEPIRYPVGFKNRHTCLCSISIDKEKNECKFYNYINARKNIYLPNYLNSLDSQQAQPKLNILRKKLKEGRNLLIIEVDGPHYESLNYYKEKYNVDDDFILSNNVSIMDWNKLNIFLNDPKHPFGHGYCLAWKLMQEFNIN